MGGHLEKSRRRSDLEPEPSLSQDWPALEKGRLWKGKQGVMLESGFRDESGNLNF